jgi:type IV secretion system protein VirB9
MKKLLTFALMGLAISSGIVEAKTIPHGRREDGRIREVYYNETQVVEIPTTFGFATTVEFGNETIQTAVSGDTIGWQVIPQGNRLFIKPAEKSQAGLRGTNINVITNKRNYYLHVYIGSRLDPVFVVRYKYDKPPAPPSASNPDADTSSNTSIKGSGLIKPYKNYNYSFTGSKSIVVQKIFDDGQFTYFKFDPRRPLPAIYKVNDSGRDEIVNTRQEGDFVVVEKVGQLFTLKDGDLHKCVRNNSDKPVYERKEPYAIPGLPNNRR